MADLNSAYRYCNRWYYQNGIAIESKRIEFLSAPPHVLWSYTERLGAHMGMMKEDINEIEN
jgi:hypothetical protein